MYTNLLLINFVYCICTFISLLSSKYIGFSLMHLYKKTFFSNPFHLFRFLKNQCRLSLTKNILKNLHKNFFRFLLIQKLVRALKTFYISKIIHVFLAIQYIQLNIFSCIYFMYIDTKLIKTVYRYNKMVMLSLFDVMAYSATLQQSPELACQSQKLYTIWENSELQNCTV